MRKTAVIFILLVIVTAAVAFTGRPDSAASLRRIYSRPASQWPAPFVDEGVAWAELSVMPRPPLSDTGSRQQLAELGKLLFFDNRLSGSGKISCSSCHQPELSWTDGKPRSVGHEGQLNKRNSPSLQNVWIYKRLFWDGRSSSLEDQAFAPINSESEMHGDIRELPRLLRKISGYPPLFEAAFGDARINPDRIAEALAAFQRTIFSQPGRFDAFLNGDRKALTNKELRGLHLFRTKARCMNCHSGPFFTDNQFHNNGLAGEDVGLYHLTHRDEDLGKMKTPSLRDVMMTAPWMHNGAFSNISGILDHYASPQKPAGTDSLLRELPLSEKDKSDLIAFLYAISSPPVSFAKPDSLP